MRRRILLLAMATGLSVAALAAGLAPPADTGADEVRLTRKMPPDPPDPGKPPKPSREPAPRIA